jgi:hypothetical protein
MIIENKDATTFEVFDSGFVFGIKKTGFYWVCFKAVNNSGQNSTYTIYRSTTSPTSGYTTFDTTPYATTVNIPIVHYTIYELTTAPSYFMVGTASSQSPYYNIISFERIPTDQTTIVQTTNNYTNPPLNIISWFSMWKIQLQTSSTNNVLFSNGTSPVFYMRVPVGGMD